MRIVCKYIDVDKSNQSATALREAGLRATPARRAVLSILRNSTEPLDAAAIMDKLPQPAPDQATVYRILTSFAEAELVRPVMIKPGTTSFELTDRPHHHHLICERCGYVEDVTACCDDPRPTPKTFQAITNHQLEFTGICTKCA